ncbi:hypothetical protein OH809_19570 [Streptomyces sp. NBC_00873]|uniref:hypothetical protein n=1 Tax=Streptomyces sp. NBC_00873 TaxID=2975852 RepID=UPI003864DE16|nr:hypothetical protein OH809_19570 [Streptomyces sp. NBC_00873]
MPDLPTPTRLSPIRDDHAGHFPDINGHRTHVRLRVWPTKDGGHLVIATDLQLGAGLINAAESLVRACAREFGEPVMVVRHYPPHFPWSLWHGVAPNNSGNVRKSVILRFGQLWIRPNDHDRMAEHTVARMTRRQRRICGHFGRQPDPMDWYFPTDQATIMGREQATR